LAQNVKRPSGKPLVGLDPQVRLNRETQGAMMIRPHLRAKAPVPTGGRVPRRFGNTRAEFEQNPRFCRLPWLAFTLAPHLQTINYRGRFSPFGGI